MIGGGKFGLKAVKFAKNSNSRTILIDNDPHCIALEMVDKSYDKIGDLLDDLDELHETGVFFLLQEGVYLERLIECFNPDYIIPVIPVHYMALQISSLFKDCNKTMLPNSSLTEIFLSEVDPNILLNYDLQSGIALLSYAKQGETCPDNCSGPIDYCPNFKRQKPMTITKYLKDYFSCDTINIDIGHSKKITIIVESEPLQAGLGGLRGNDVKKIIEKLKEKKEFLKTRKIEIIVATTCNCHGVINFFKNYK